MYFTPEPKTRREDFFDMEEALKDFQRYVRTSKLTLVTGLRRYGKTSLILTGLNEMGEDYVFMDCRLLPAGMISIKDFLKLLVTQARGRVRAALKRVEEVRLAGLGVKVRPSYDTLLEALKSIEGKVLVLDEAQELRRSKHRFDRLLAYIYDHMNVRLVVSGSQVGLLHKFLRLDDPEAPLFGRAYAEVKVPRLTRELSLEFLREGFSQHSMSPEEGLLELAVDFFDGIIGWLAYFGYTSVLRGGVSEGIIKETVRMASKLALAEFNHAVQGERYREVMRITSLLGGARWSEIKRGVEARLGRIPDKSLAKVLKKLVDTGFLDKVEGVYRITDPVLAYAFKELG